MKKILAIVLLLSVKLVSGQNPLLVQDNTPINYPAIDAAAIKDAVSEVITQSDKKIADIITASSNPTIENTLFAYDDLQYSISDLSSRIGLVAACYSNDDTRNAAFAENSRLSQYASDIYLNEPLYNAIKQFQNAKKEKPLTESQTKFINDIVLAFEKNGMKLNADERKELSNLNSRLIELGNEFDKNIAESRDSLSYKESQLKGVPQDDINTWKNAEGTCVIYINFPNYVKVMENADSPDIRKEVYMHYNNRAYPANMAVLDSLIYYRNLFAKKLGFTSYAAYAVSDKMAATPETVWNFERDIINRLSPLVREEVSALKMLKAQLNPEQPGEFYAWDYSYYTKKMMNSKYHLNPDEVSEYFEMNNTLKGMFTVYENLFGIKIVATKGLPVWDPKIKTYDIYKDGKKTGSFYLDLYPRPHKYTHFECNPIGQYRKTKTSETLPVAALICNFSPGTAAKPSLLKHGDVITLFHEFGHLVHWELCHPAIASQNAFGTKGDFVEAPSQFLENWCWEYDALKLFAKHYKTGKVLPLSLFNKMKAAQMLNSGSNNIRQVYLGTTDFTFEDKYNETKSKGLMQVVREQFAVTQLPFPEGSHFICSFTHLSGYGANYYGYLWSKVYAQDMFSVFQKTGVMNQATGIKYRKEILEKGSTVNEKDMVDQFLGRKSNSDAFLKSLGVK